MITLPDDITINEVRVSKSDVRSIRAWNLSFDAADRHAVEGHLRRNRCRFLRVGPASVSIVDADGAPDAIEHLVEERNVEIDRGVVSLADLPAETRRRWLFRFVESQARTGGVYRGEGWQLFTLTTPFTHGYEAVDIDIREEDTTYRIFCNPTILILLPITVFSPSQLTANRSLVRIVPQSDADAISRWNLPSDPGWLGYFACVDCAESPRCTDTIPRECAIVVKPSYRSQHTFRSPAFATRVVALRHEVDSLDLSKKHRRELQPLPYFRLRRTQQWLNRLFPTRTLTVGVHGIPVDVRAGAFGSPSRYPDLSGSPHVWYPEAGLLFDPLGNKTHTVQLSGLKKYGPFDHASATRPFRQIRPYLIAPDNVDLTRLTDRLFQLLAGGYAKRNNADFPDDAFPGMSASTTFHTQLIPPTSKDIINVDGTSEGYRRAAQRLLRTWAIDERRAEDRIVVVIVPDLYDGQGHDDDSDDPYPDLKKILVEGGLPSQMMEVHKLRGIEQPQVAFGHVLWTFALDLYVKLGGKPWTLLRPMADVNCLIGIGFGRSHDASRKPIYVGVANVFDEGGQWLSVSSDDRELTDQDLLSMENREYGAEGTNSFKLHHELTRRIVGDSLDAYVTPTSSEPATKVVLHKNGIMYESEAIGFLQAFRNSLGRDQALLSRVAFGLVSIYKNHHIRMYGPDYPKESWPMRNAVSRGSAYVLNENTIILATTGKNAYSYPGIGTPRPIVVQRFVPSTATLGSVGLSTQQMYSVEQICEQVMALTKLHWGTTRNIRLPVTSEYAHRIARLVAASGIRVDSVLKWKKPWWI